MKATDHKESSKQIDKENRERRLTCANWSSSDDDCSSSSSSEDDHLCQCQCQCHAGEDDDDVDEQTVDDARPIIIMVKPWKKSQPSEAKQFRVSRKRWTILAGLCIFGLLNGLVSLLSRLADSYR